MRFSDIIDRIKRKLSRVLRLSDGLSVSGYVEVFDARTGELLAANRNMVVDEGLDLLADILAGVTSDGLLYLAAGTSSTASTAGMTALTAEVWRDAVVTRTSSGATLVVSAFLDTGEANGSTLTEFGLFTASSGGRMFNRVVLSPGVAKDATKTLTVQVTFTFSR